MSEAQQVWEERYGERGRIWSGKVNDRLAEVAATLKPGHALDLGCGEGGDALWLADNGWHVTAVDISQTALDRAKTDAKARKLDQRIEFQRLDLTESLPDGSFDLVSAQFLHSTVEFDRTALLRAVAGTVKPGGVLLIADHAAAPPWANPDIHHHEFPSAEQVLGALNLDDSQWDRTRVEAVDREASGPDGQSAVITDNVMVLTRRESRRSSV